MYSNYKQTILVSLLTNPAVVPSAVAKILRHADDSWDWRSALGECALPDQCIPVVAKLLDDQLAKAIQMQIAEVEAKKEFDELEFEVDEDLINAIVWLIEQPGASLDTTRSILEKLEQSNLHWSCYKFIVEAAVKNENNRAGFLDFFITSTNKIFLTETASNPGTPSEFLELLAKSASLDVLEVLAGNPAASSALLMDLAKNHWELLMSPISDNPNLPKELIERIARSDDWSARYGLVQRDDLEESVIRILGADEDDSIRCHVCRKAGLPPDLVARLACDPEEFVRVEIAKRTDLSAELIQELYQSHSMEIDRSLAANAAITDAMRDAYVQTNDRELLGASFSNPRLTELQLTKLSKEKNKSWVRAWLHSQKRLCAQAIEILATCKHAEVRERLAHMDDLPESVVAKLAVDPNADVRTAVALHPECTDALLKVIIAQHGEDGDFHLPLRIAQSEKSAEVLELMFERILQVHQEAIANYKEMKTQGGKVFIVPKDFRSLNSFYSNPLASDQIRATVASIYNHLAEYDKGLALADGLADGVITAKAAREILSEKLTAEDSEQFLMGFTSCRRPDEKAVDFLVKTVTRAA